MFISTMRAKIDLDKKHTARGVSLPPDLERVAMHRCVDLDLSFSKYVQSLIAIDLRRKVIRVPKAKI